MAKKKEETKSSKGNLHLQPLGDRVVVEREESEQVTSGGIVLPDTAKDKPTRGTVIQRRRRPAAEGRPAGPACRSSRAIASCSPLMPARRSSWATGNCS